MNKRYPENRIENGRLRLKQKHAADPLTRLAMPSFHVGHFPWTKIMHSVIANDVISGESRSLSQAGGQTRPLRPASLFFSFLLSTAVCDGALSRLVRCPSMLRWTLLATVCNSVLQVSIASAPLVGGEGKDELRSHSISNALGVPDHSQNHVSDFTKASISRSIVLLTRLL